MNGRPCEQNVGPPVRPVLGADTGGRRGLSRASLIAILIVLAVLPYVNTLQNGFVYDDHNEVLTNPYIRSFGDIKEVFTTRVLEHLGVRGATNYYRPVSVFGFLLCYQLFGDLPYGFHLANLLLNAIVVLLLFTVKERVFKSPRLACLSAAIFAVHPIHT